MDVNVFCNNCSSSRTVSEGSAGMRFQCDCGGELVVPSLQEIRRQLGISVMEHSPEFEIPRLVKLGELPPDHCVACKGFADHTLSFNAVCAEGSTSSNRSGSIAQFTETVTWCLSFIILGVFNTFSFIIRTENRAPKFHGHDLVISVPVRMCGHCAEGVLQNGQVAGLQKLNPMLLIAAAVLLVIDWLWALIPVVIYLGLLILEASRERTRKKEWLKLIRLVPAYALLIRKYPDAFIE